MDPCIFHVIVCDDYLLASRAAMCWPLLIFGTLYIIFLWHDAILAKAINVEVDVLPAFGLQLGLEEAIWDFGLQLFHFEHVFHLNGWSLLFLLTDLDLESWSERALGH